MAINSGYFTQPLLMLTVAKSLTDVIETKRHLITQLFIKKFCADSRNTTKIFNEAEVMKSARVF